MRTDQTSTGTRVDHFGRSTPPTPTCGSSWADRGENSEPGATHPRKRRLTPAIRELQRGRITLIIRWSHLPTHPFGRRWRRISAWGRRRRGERVGRRRPDPVGYAGSELGPKRQPAPSFY